MIEKYIPIIDEISLKYNYPDNIRHLLYVILPAFVIKYNKENFIINCLNNIPIIITGKEDPKIQALYVSYPYLEETVKTKKAIYLNRYNNIPFLQLLDNLIHELNHAINSFQNEIILEKDYFYLRTGLTKTKYNLKDFKIIDKNRSYVLEEIINSKQTEQLINIISNLKSDNEIISNTIYAVKNSINGNYISSAYYSLKYYCKKLLDNKTFLLTLENLRINGNIDDIEYWFDGIYGEKGYQNLTNNLYELKELQNKKGFLIERKINKLAIKLIKISDQFNKNSNLKA